VDRQRGAGHVARGRLCQQRGDLGEAWLARRNAYLARGCASRAQVAALVGRAYDEGLLPADEED